LDIKKCEKSARCAKCCFAKSFELCFHASLNHFYEHCSGRICDESKRWLRIQNSLRCLMGREMPRCVDCWLPLSDFARCEENEMEKGKKKLLARPIPAKSESQLTGHIEESIRRMPLELILFRKSPSTSATCLEPKKSPRKHYNLISLLFFDEISFSKLFFRPL
jgi:hypothetical protein